MKTFETSSALVLVFSIRFKIPLVSVDNPLIHVGFFCVFPSFPLVSVSAIYVKSLVIHLCCIM
jgi:hypothetical protein